MSTTAITVLGLAEGVCKATASLIDVFNSGRQLRRREMNELKIRIDYFLRSEYARQSGELVRVHIEEIAKTQRYIDEQNLTGTALNLAMSQLEALNSKLSNSLHNFSCH